MSVRSRALLLVALLIVLAGCSRSSKPVRSLSKSAVAPVVSSSPSEEEALSSSSSDEEKPLPDLPPTGVARIDENGILITAKGKQRRPASDKKFADVMDNIVLVVPAIYDGRESATCNLENAETGEIVGNVSTNNIVAGGTIVECTKLAAHAKVVVMFNSRGTYAKEVSSGRLLPCGAGGVFADDFKTCLRLDTSPIVYTGDDSPGGPDRPFPIEICAVDYALCRPLITIKRGLNRAPGTRNWDGAYCSDDRVAILAEGELHIFNARSRRELSVEPAPQKTKVTCATGKPITS